MCLLDLIPHYLSSTEIADVFGVTRQAINLIEHSAIKKIQRKLKLMDGPFAKGGTTVNKNLPLGGAILEIV
jgi:transcriptional regulator